MKKNRLFVLGMVAFLLAFSMFMTGCGNRDPLVGRWEHQSGDWIYFFGESSIIEFKADGTVISHDEDESGNWTAFGGERLRIDPDSGRSLNFTYSINNNILTIIDSDGDIGRWRKTR